MSRCGTGFRRACWGRGLPLWYLGKNPVTVSLLESPSHLQLHDPPPPRSPGPSQVPLPGLWGQWVRRPQTGPAAALGTCAPRSPQPLCGTGMKGM